MASCCEKESNYISELLYKATTGDVSCGSSQANNKVISDGEFEIDCTSYNAGDCTKLVQVRLMEYMLAPGVLHKEDIRLHLFATDPSLSAGGSVSFSASFNYLGYVDFSSSAYTEISDSGSGTTVGYVYGDFPADFNGYISTSASRMMYGVLENKSGGALDCTGHSFDVELIFAK